MGPVITPAGGGTFIFLANSVGGTANALTVPTVTPSTFQLVDRYAIYFRPASFNTGAVTINVAGTGAVPFKKISPSGYSDMDAGDFAPGAFVFGIYDATNNVFQSVTTIYEPKPIVTATGFTVDFSALFNRYVMTAVSTITLPLLATLPGYFYFEVQAKGGAVTITPNAANSVQGGANGVSYVIPQGTYGVVYIGNDGKWYINGTATVALAGRTITGTANRITVVNGDGAAGNPTLDISSSYVGQSTITTLGTIATGVWNGTIVGSTYGGTGVNNGVKTITLGGNLTTSGAFATTLTVTGATNVTLPTTGTLVNDAVTTLSSLVSVGTITTGVWNGTVITGQYGGTGVNNSGKTITLGGNFVTSGAFATTLTITNTTNVTLPLTGTLATLAGAESLTNKTFDATSTVATATAGDSSTKLANTAFVAGEIGRKTGPNFPNASCMVAQRSVAPSLTTSRLIGQTDNIKIWASGGAVGAGTLNNVSNSISGKTGYAARAAGVTLTGSGVISAAISMESLDALKYKNQTVSVSVKVDHDVGSAINYTLVLKKPTVLNTFSAFTTIATSGTTSVASATATTISFSNVSIGDITNGLELEVQAACGAVTTKNFSFTEFMIETATVAGTYVGSDYELEVARCQRYLPAFKVTSTGFFLFGGAYTTTNAFASMALPVPSRIATTGLTVVGGTLSFSTAAGSVTGTAVFGGASTTESIATFTSSGASGLVAGNASIIQAGTGTSSFYFTGAELI